MSLYSDLHTVIRKAVNRTVIAYNKDGRSETILPLADDLSVLEYIGEAIPILWSLDMHPESGPHAVVSYTTTDPTAQDLGGLPPQELSGILQFMIKLPRTDPALDSQLANLVDQVWVQYPISDYQDGNIKFIIENVGRTSVTTMGGYASVSARVNFRINYC